MRLILPSFLPDEFVNSGSGCGKGVIFHIFSCSLIRKAPTARSGGESVFTRLRVGFAQAFFKGFFVLVQTAAPTFFHELLQSEYSTS